MAVETALSLLRAGERRSLSPAIVISGPQAFLREYVFDAVRRRLVRKGLQCRVFHIGGSDGFDAVLAELREADLFAPARLVACRVLRSHRGGGSDEDGAATTSGSRRPSPAGGEAALAQALATIREPGALVVVYERDSAPARIRRAVEEGGLAINCPRPYDNQLTQFAEAIARTEGVPLAAGAADLLVSRHAGDLAAIANTLAKAAIWKPEGEIGPADLSEPAAARIPELFDLAEALSRGRAPAAFAVLERAIGVGRDPFELLSVEIVPVMRRMMLAASMAAEHRSAQQIAGALGLSPSSPLAVRAIDGARRFGLPRLSRAYQRVSEVDAGFKNGRIKERHAALATILLDLLGPPAGS